MRSEPRCVGVWIERAAIALAAVVALVLLAALLARAAHAQCTDFSLYAGNTACCAIAGDNGNLSVTGPFTVVAWVKTIDNTVRQSIVWKSDFFGGRGYYFELAASGKLSASSCDNSGCTTGAGNTTVSNNTWHCTAAVYDGSLMNIYLDGAPDGSTADTRNPTDGPNPLNIGCVHEDVSTETWLGKLDDVAVYNTALSAGDIATLCGGTDVPAGRVSWWRFNEGSGTTNGDATDTNPATLAGLNCTTGGYSTDVPGTQPPVCSPTPAPSDTPTATVTPTATATATATNTPTSTPTASPTLTGTQPATATPSDTSIPTPTPTETLTSVPSATVSTTPTQPTATMTRTRTATIVRTPTRTATSGPTGTITPSCHTVRVTGTVYSAPGVPARGKHVTFQVAHIEAPLAHCVIRPSVWTYTTDNTGAMPANAFIVGKATVVVTLQNGQGSTATLPADGQVDIGRLLQMPVPPTPRPWQ